MSQIKAWKLISLFCLVSLLMGCESKEEQLKQTIQQSIEKAEVELNQLGTALDNGSLRNATILKQYGKVLAEQQPQLSEIARVISLDATREGAIYSGLTQRLADVSLLF